MRELDKELQQAVLTAGASPEAADILLGNLSRRAKQELLSALKSVAMARSSQHTASLEPPFIALSIRSETLPDTGIWLIAQVAFLGHAGEGRSRREVDAWAMAFEDLAKKLYVGPPREARE